MVIHDQCIATEDISHSFDIFLYNMNHKFMRIMNIHTGENACLLCCSTRIPTHAQCYYKYMPSQNSPISSLLICVNGVVNVDHCNYV